MFIGRLFIVLFVSLVCMNVAEGNPVIAVLARLGMGLLSFGARSARRRASSVPTINAPNPTVNTFHGGEFEGDIYLGGSSGRGIGRSPDARGGLGALGQLGKLRELGRLGALGRLGGIGGLGALGRLEALRRLGALGGLGGIGRLGGVGNIGGFGNPGLMGNVDGLDALDGGIADMPLID